MKIFISLGTLLLLVGVFIPLGYSQEIQLGLVDQPLRSDFHNYLYKPIKMHYRFGDIGEFKPVSPRDSELLKVLALDSEAIRHFKKYKKRRTTSQVIASVAFLGGITGVVLNMLGFDDLGQEDRIIPRSGTSLTVGSLVFGLSFAGIFNISSRKSMVKSIDIYNKNGGYSNQYHPRDKMEFGLGIDRNGLGLMCRF